MQKNIVSAVNRALGTQAPKKPTKAPVKKPDNTELEKLREEVERLTSMVEDLQASVAAAQEKNLQLQKKIDSVAVKDTPMKKTTKAKRNKSGRKK